jgi:peptide/nickel transport system substrate-binding protein
MNPPPPADRGTTVFHLLSRRAAAAAAVLALTAAGLSGCASGTAHSGTPDVMTVAGPYRITGLDPQGTLAADNGTELAAKQIFGSLVVRDGTSFTPGLAASWHSGDGGRVWTFRLRDGLRFSDGSALTSGDVKASVARVVKLGGPLAALWAGVAVTAPSAGTVVFTAKQPQGALLSKASTLSVLPAAEVGRAGFFGKPVGSGPFEVSSFSPGQSLTLVPNPEYWGAKPSLKKLTIEFISNISARITALKTGEVQATWALPDDQVAQLAGQKGITTQAVASDAQYTMWFNSGRPAFRSAAVRQAMWKAVDYASIIKSLYPATGSPAKAPLSSTIAGYAAQDPYPYDPAAAKAALRKAGFDFGKSYQLAYSGDEFTQFAQAVASDFAKIGVKVVPTEKEKAVYLSDLLGMKWDINLQSLSDATGDADYVLGRLYTCAAARTGFCDHALDSVLAQAGATADPARRAALYGTAERTIWSQAVGMFPMDVRIAYSWTSRVSGFAPSSDYQPAFAGVKVS